MIVSTRYRALAEIHRQSDLSSQIAKLQQSVSSGKRISTPSDDPEASSRIAEIRQSQADQIVWRSNTSMGTSIAAAADTRLSAVAEALDRAKELVLSGRNDTTSPIDRAAIATELRSIAADLNATQSATDPTGAPLFPDTAPLMIPVSDTLALPATASRSAVFGSVTTANGTKSLNDILNDAATAIESGDTATRYDDVQASLTELDAGASHMVRARADQGVRAGRFDIAMDELDTRDENYSEERLGLESTDLTYALSEYQQKQVSLQAAQTIFAQSNRTSLFDMLG